MNKKYLLNYVFYYLIQLTWGLAQNILGLGLFIWLSILNLKRKRFIYHGSIVSNWGLKTSCGLGMFIFLGDGNLKDNDDILVHEYGHTLQSVFLGPFFLIIIGIPSLAWALLPHFIRMRKQKKIKYTSFYPEAWANSWGEKVLKKAALTN